ncbi:hypothetical protein GAW91_000224 [Vibrio fluvialis]|nr:hypothetical protein [Vibrio fluvialis]
MKPLIALTIAAALAGCSSAPDVAESMPNPDEHVVSKRVDISQELNASYCDMNGFARFHESERYYTFECTTGSKFRVPK